MRFKKRSVVSEAWMAQVAARERRLRLRLAERLRRRAAKLTRRQLQWCIVMFISGGFMVYTWIAVEAVTGRQKPVDFVVYKAAVAQRMAGWYPEERASFRSYLDSINGNP